MNIWRRGCESVKVKLDFQKPLSGKLKINLINFSRAYRLLENRVLLSHFHICTHKCLVVFEIFHRGNCVVEVWRIVAKKQLLKLHDILYIYELCIPYTRARLKAESALINLISGGNLPIGNMMAGISTRAWCSTITARSILVLPRAVILVYRAQY
mgnify:CR=1 FL=1